MDPIILLLASQLLIITAVLLSCSESKLNRKTLTISERLSFYVFKIIGVQRDEEMLEFAIDSAKRKEPIRAKSENLTVLEHESEISLKNEQARLLDVEKPSSGVNLSVEMSRFGGRQDSTSLLSMGPELNEDNSDHTCGPYSLKRLLTFNFIQRVLRLASKWSFRIVSTTKPLPNRPDSTEITTKAHQARPSESIYLLKIIAARKTEKIIRHKIAKLNITIKKTRRGRFLELIPELTETDC